MTNYDRFESVCMQLSIDERMQVLLSNYFSNDELGEFTDYLIKEYDLEEEEDD